MRAKEKQRVAMEAYATASRSSSTDLAVFVDGSSLTKHRAADGGHPCGAAAILVDYWQATSSSAAPLSSNNECNSRSSRDSVSSSVGIPNGQCGVAEVRAFDLGMRLVNEWLDRNCERLDDNNNDKGTTFAAGATRPSPDLYIFSDAQQVVHETGGSVQFADDNSPTGRHSHYVEMKQRFEALRARFPGTVHLFWIKRNSAPEMKQVDQMARDAANGQIIINKASDASEGEEPAAKKSKVEK